MKLTRKRFIVLMVGSANLPEHSVEAATLQAPASRTIGQAHQPPAPPSSASPPLAGPNWKAYGNALDGSTAAPPFAPAFNTIDPAKILPAVPWSTFVDDKQTIALSANGAEPVEDVEPKGIRHQRLHVYAHQNGLWWGTKVVDGSGVRDIYPSKGEDATAILTFLQSYPTRGGVRERHIMTPYMTWHGHTRRLATGELARGMNVPMWVGIDFTGQMVFAHRDGSTEIPFSVPIISYANDFSFFEPRELNLFFVTDTGAGKILSVNRKTLETKTVASGFKRVTSVRAVPDDASKPHEANSLYACDPDTDGGSVWKVNPVTGAKAKVANVPLAFWIDHTSTGDLVVMTLTRRLHRVTKAGAVGPDLFAGNGTLQKWVQCDVDRHGTMGAVDAIVAVSTVSGNNATPHRFVGDRATPYVYSMGTASCGLIRHCSDLFGHYLWTVSHHPDDGALMVQGHANVQPTLITVRPSADVSNYEHTYSLMEAGRKTLISKGLVSVMNPQGGSQLCSADAIAEMPFPQAEAYIRSGMAGTNKPTFTPSEMVALLYFVYRNSQQFLKRGKALMDELSAYSKTIV